MEITKILTILPFFWVGRTAVFRKCTQQNNLQDEKGLIYFGKRSKNCAPSIRFWKFVIEIKKALTILPFFCAGRTAVSGKFPQRNSLQDQKGRIYFGKGTPGHPSRITSGYRNKQTRKVQNVAHIKSKDGPFYFLFRRCRYRDVLSKNSHKVPIIISIRNICSFVVKSFMKVIIALLEFFCKFSSFFVE